MMAMGLRLGRAATIAGFAVLLASWSLRAQAIGNITPQAVLQIRHGGSYLGVALQDVDEAAAQAARLKEITGVLITNIEENGAADQAGLRAGDIILRYNGEAALGAHQLGRLVAETPEGRKVGIRIWRGGKAEDINVTTGSRPVALWDSNEISPQVLVTDIPAPLMVWRNMILGFDYEPLNVQLAQFFGVKQGSLIRSVQPGSLAEKAGIRAGDVLTAVAGRLLTSPRDLGSAIQMDKHALKPLPIDITRERKTITVVISLATQ